MSNTASVEVVAGDTTNLDAHMSSQQRWEREHGAGCAGAQRAQTWPDRSTRAEVTTLESSTTTTRYAPLGLLHVSIRSMGLRSRKLYT